MKVKKILILAVATILLSIMFSSVAVAEDDDTPGFHIQKEFIDIKGEWVPLDIDMSHDTAFWDPGFHI